ncbi:TRAP transporter small permease [Tropicimonas sp. TH_r6]|uniref:TRAP transporter small permease n=1 Tax=Tropicimonas sp. TH_r6 TaxID=3082085 RepID=UPI00295469C1|nr:TRAP transporter small permease [Tropicimonas sp. TH_r6]MDV7145596.1 TRAP transporter small permease [Tropicimonas sp. TH_r6]
MKQIRNFLDSAEGIVTNIAMAVLLGSVLWGVLTRYVTAKPAVWTTELSGILFTWVVFIGALTAFRKNQHIRVSLLVDSLPLPAQRIARILSDLVVLSFVGYSAWLSFIMMGKGATRMSPVMDIPFSYVYLAPFIAFSIMTLGALLDIFSPGLLAGKDEDAAEVL